MAVIKGLGVVWSTTGMSLAGTGVYATGKIQSIEYELGAEKVELKGDDGDVKAVVFNNTIERITVNVAPTGATISAANAANVLPAIGADVTVTDSQDSEINSAVFMFDGGTKSRSVDGAAMLRMNLSRYGLATMNTVS